MSSSHYVVKGQPGMNQYNKGYPGGGVSRQPIPDVQVKKSNTGGNGQALGLQSN